MSLENVVKTIITFMLTVLIAIGGYMYTAMEKRVANLETGMTDLKIMVGGRDWAMKRSEDASIREMLKKISEEISKQE